MFRMKTVELHFIRKRHASTGERSVSLYEPRGDYQLIIDSTYPAGEGLLQQQFEALKIKLSSEGLFRTKSEKITALFVKRLKRRTSATGAALQDILHILKRRDLSLKVIIYPTAVQEDAAAEIVQAIEIGESSQ